MGARSASPAAAPQYSAATAATLSPVERARVAIVGAGFSGLGMAIALKRAGIEDFVVLERAEDPGGTWRDNTYPGCACDVQSDLYSFSFAPNPEWRRVFSPQPHIWAYLRRCVRQFGIAPHLRAGHEVREAAWDEGAWCWRITTGRGRFVADALVLGAGPLSEPAFPAIPGLNRFAGTIFHSARWDHGHDLTGERVAVIGTGASAIQFVPEIAPRVGQLSLFMRTPPWVVPRLDRPVSDARRALYRAFPLAQRLVRTVIYWRRELGALAFLRPQVMAKTEADVLRFMASQVRDPDLRAKLTPDYRMGCKRILLSDDFYPALNRPNVEVVAERIREVRPAGIVTEDGVERAVDTIILATGFRATDAPFAERVRGRGGRTLADAWREGQRAYLGITVSGFPNLFLGLGPHTGLGHSSVIVMIEAQIGYILGCLRLMARRGLAAVEPRPEAEGRFEGEMDRRMGRTVWKTGCRSWYLDARGRNTTLWPGFTWQYILRVRRFDLRAYLLTRREPTRNG
jgi:cation diffusion facilitator CzcD-associated flavoprotein CzcO